MIEYPHYSRPPIQEAVLDIGVEFDTPPAMDLLNKVHDPERERYPKQNERIFVHGEISAGARLSAVAQQGILGFMFVAEDGKQMFQSRMNGFTLNRLAPYDRWETFSEEARRLWIIYKTVVNPTRINRLALRYINRFDFPEPVARITDYFTTAPVVSQDLPQEPLQYFLQLQLFLAEIETRLTINQAIVPPVIPGNLSIVMDIEASRQKSVPQQEDEIWNFFDNLRSVKNQVFNGSLTEKTKEMIV
jgi:uncharacterized protein (TIGR04255 family)